MDTLAIGTVSRVLRSIRSRTGLIVLLAAVQGLLSLSSVWYALLLRNTIDAAVQGAADAFVGSITVFALLLACQLLLRAVLRWAQEYALAGVENALRHRLFSCLMRRDYAQVTAVHSGEWLNRMQSDVRVTAEGLCVVLPQLIGTCVRLVGAAAMILVLETRLGLILIPCGVLAGVCAWGFRKRLKALHIHSQKKEGAVRVCMQEALSSLMVVKAFGRENDAEARADEQMREHMAARMRKNRFSNACNAGFGTAMQGAYLVGLLFCGGGILSGSMTYGTCTAILQLVGQIQSPLVSITGHLPKLIAALGSAERLHEAEDMRSDDGCCAQEPAVGRYYEEHFEGIGLRDVSFSYEEDGQERRVYEGLSLSIDKGSCTAITGPSGCGKSTLLKLLLCLYEPEKGQCVLREDGAERTLTAADRGLFAYVPQGNHLLGGSIRQALTFGDEEKMRCEEKLTAALDAACALEFVQELQEGLDTPLGEHGQGLSEGQLQRVAIARALVSGRPILLLDECTSALDEATEERLIENIRRMTDKTVILVTHRPRALRVCSQHIVMDKGA